MAQITITIPNDKLDTILDAFTHQYYYDSETDGTKAQFVKSKIIEYIKDNVRNHNEYLARQQPQTDIVIT